MNTCKACGAVLDFETENGAICDQCRIECTRLTHLIEETKRPLTGREEVEIQLEHQALVKNMTDEELEAHILDLDKKIASFRIKAMDARRERAERESFQAGTCPHSAPHTTYDGDGTVHYGYVSKRARARILRHALKKQYPEVADRVSKRARARILRHCTPCKVLRLLDL